MRFWNISNSWTKNYQIFFFGFRRKNLAVHLGLDNKVGIREVQKINTYCLPVPANNFDGGAPDTSSGAGEMEVVSDDVKVANFCSFSFFIWESVTCICDITSREKC